MQTLGRVGTTLGFLSLGAALLLSLPGIRVARADGGDATQFERFEQFVSQSGTAPSSAPGPSCEAGPSRAITQEARAEQLLAQVRAQLAARAAAAGPSQDADGVVLLNGRGYNY